MESENKKMSGALNAFLTRRLGAEEELKQQRETISQQSEKLEQVVRELTRQTQAVADSDKALSDKDHALANKDNLLADKDKLLADKDKLLADKDKELTEIIEELDEFHKQVADKQQRILDVESDNYEYQRLLDNVRHQAAELEKERSALSEETQLAHNSLSGLEGVLGELKKKVALSALLSDVAVEEAEMLRSQLSVAEQQVVQLTEALSEPAPLVLQKDAVSSLRFVSSYNFQAEEILAGPIQQLEGGRQAEWHLRDVLFDGSHLSSVVLNLTYQHGINDLHVSSLDGSLHAFKVSPSAVHQASTQSISKKPTISATQFVLLEKMLGYLYQQYTCRTLELHKRTTYKQQRLWQLTLGRAVREVEAIRGYYYVDDEDIRRPTEASNQCLIVLHGLLYAGRFFDEMQIELRFGVNGEFTRSERDSVVDTISMTFLPLADGTGSLEAWLYQESYAAEVVFDLQKRSIDFLNDTSLSSFDQDLIGEILNHVSSLGAKCPSGLELSSSDWSTAFQKAYSVYQSSRVHFGL